MILSSLLLFTGCTSNQKSQEKSPQIVKPDFIISVDAGLVTNDFLNFIDTFSTKYKVDVEVAKRPSGIAGENEVMTELLTSNAPDILLFSSGGLFKALDPREYFYDLSGEAYVNQYIESYRQAVSVENEIYGLPLDNADAIGFIYRKDIYDKLNLSIPKDWESFVNNLQALKNNNIVPLLTPFKDQWLTQYYWYVAEYANSTSDNIEQYRDILKKIDQLRANEFLSPNLLTMSLSMGLNDFGNKNSTHLLGQYSFRNYLTTNHVVSEEDIGFFPFPNQGNQYIYMLPSSLYINKKSKEIKLCKLFFEEYYKEKIEKKESTREQPGILKTAEIKPERIIYEQQMDYKVDVLPELLLDFFTGNLTADEVIQQYQLRDEELKLIYH